MSKKTIIILTASVLVVGGIATYFVFFNKTAATAEEKPASNQTADLTTSVGGVMNQWGILV